MLSDHEKETSVKLAQNDDCSEGSIEKELTADKKSVKEENVEQDAA